MPDTLSPGVLAAILMGAVQTGSTIAVVVWQFAKLSERVAKLEQAMHDTRGKSMQALHDRITEFEDRTRSEFDAHERRFHAHQVRGT